MRYANKHHAARPEMSEYSKLKFLVGVSPHAEVDDGKVHSWLLQGRDLDLDAYDAKHSTEQKQQRATEFKQCSCLFIQAIYSCAYQYTLLISSDLKWCRTSPQGLCMQSWHTATIALLGLKTCSWVQQMRYPQPLD